PVWQATSGRMPARSTRRTGARGPRTPAAHIERWNEPPPAGHSWRASSSVAALLTRARADDNPGLRVLGRAVPLLDAAVLPHRRAAFDPLPRVRAVECRSRERKGLGMF